MNSLPRVSVIVVNYNGWILLERCLHGLHTQTYRDLEVVVVDNGSDDGSAENVRRVFPNVKLIALDRNAGFCEGNNRGIAIARGEYIALLNNDAVPDCHWLEELIKAGERHPECGFFASRVLRQDDAGTLDSAGDGITLAGTAYRRGHLRPASQYAREEFVFGASGSAAFYRRAMLQEIGLFDEDLFMVYEDVDLSFRAQLAGYRCLYVPTAIVHHKGSGTIGRFTDFYVYQTQRNVEIIFLKDMPAVLFWLLLPFHLFYNLGGWIFFALVARRSSAFLRAKRDALSSARKILHKRRTVQIGRRVSVCYLVSFLELSWVSRIAEEKIKQI